jgi:hypothetical protein
MTGGRHPPHEKEHTMRIRQIAATGVAGLTAAAMLTLGAGTANAATTEPCPGTGPAASLPTATHDAFLKEMTALKAQRDAIMKKYGTTPAAGQGQGAGQRAGGQGRGTGTRLTTSQRTAKQAELAKWRVSRDKLFAKYGITARTQGRSA